MKRKYESASRNADYESFTDTLIMALCRAALTAILIFMNSNDNEHYESGCKYTYAGVSYKPP